MRLSFAFQILLWSLSLAAPQAPSSSSTSTAPAPQSTACGDIVNSCNTTFTAKQAFDCLTSVPFNAAVATRFLKYYNDTLQFQSTLAYLKDPPSSYQQPSTDLIAGLTAIQQKIDSGVFKNQYAFEATLQNLVYSAHDSHLSLTSGILAAFSFASPYSIASVSVDGSQEPKVFVADDLLYEQPTFTPSAIATINGQEVTDYLSSFAAVNAVGGLESNADWNQLMTSSALYIQDYYSIFEGLITFYPGDTITLTFENGTELDPEPWIAIYNSPGPTGPLATGGDFYNFFVLGFYPASYNASAPDPCAASDGTDGSSATTSTAAASSSATGAAATSFPDSAYPEDTDIYQPNLYPDGGGFLTGYFLKNISLAVLSIPTFSMLGDDILTFSDTVGSFIQQSHVNGLTRILIDVQQNLGGDTLLAVDTFDQFFPTTDAFRGSRLRAHPTADTLGNTFTTYFDSLAPNSSTSSDYFALSASEWVATDRIDAATGLNFSSWGQFYGPNSFNGDEFTNVEQEDLSSIIFDEAALGIAVYGFANRSATAPQLYPAENIAILTDGLCASACAVFLEMMHHEAGVRTVAVGGRPQAGPMQAPSGSRGAQFYDVSDLDNDISIAEVINETTSSYLPDRSEDVLVLDAGINLRDQIRKDGSVPVQFVYEAANCRIYYTPETFSSYSNLWQYAASAIFDQPSRCVLGSTGLATTGNDTDTQGPPPGSGQNTSSIVAANMSTIVDLSGSSIDFLASSTDFEVDKPSTTRQKSGSSCTVGTSTGCPGGTCVSACGGGRCATNCNNFVRGGSCPGASTCIYTQNLGPGADYRGQPVTKRSGHCPPPACGSATFGSRDSEITKAPSAGNGGVGKSIVKGLKGGKI